MKGRREEKRGKKGKKEKKKGKKRGEKGEKRRKGEKRAKKRGEKGEKLLFRKIKEQNKQLSKNLLISTSVVKPNFLDPLEPYRLLFVTAISYIQEILPYLR